MTTPPQAPPQQPPPQPQGDGLTGAALDIAIADLLASGVLITAEVLAAIQVRFALSRATTAYLGAVLQSVTRYPPPLTGVIGAASAQSSRLNTARRVQYVIAATRRVASAAIEARARNRPVAAAVRDQLDSERRFYQMHLDAMWQRARAAGAVDLAAAEYGPLLGWYTTLDDKTSPECKDADGKNFRAEAMPDIGFPGAVHPHCRCRPGPPYQKARLLPSRGFLGYARAFA